jgi:diguanylate cyclase (GGDEF)-like protein
MAQEVLPSLPATDWRALAWRVVLAVGYWQDWQLERAQQHAIEARAAAVQNSDRAWEALVVALHGCLRSAAGQGSRALGDFVDAETLLESAGDRGLKRWAHTFLGYGFMHERLYELALPQMLIAQSIPEQPIDLKIGRLVELHTLASIHVRWAAELERVEHIDPMVRYEDVLRHVEQALSWLESADEERARVGGDDFWGDRFGRLRIHAKSFIEPETAVEDLERLRFTDVAHGNRDHGVEDSAHLARALRQVGRLHRAREVAYEGIELIGDQTPQTTRILVHHQLHVAQTELGVNGAYGIDDYVALCTRMLWEQRLGSMEAVRARRNYATLRQIHLETTRLTREDPLTGVANRRALDDWLGRNPVGPAAMVMIDLDGFKSVNDTYGHGVGDRVLRRVASCLAATSRTDDLIVRFGGDEFVIVLAGGIRDAQELGRRIRTQIVGLDLDGLPSGIVVSASVGAAEVGPGEPTTHLVDRADRYLMRTKRNRIPARVPRIDVAGVITD